MIDCGGSVMRDPETNKVKHSGILAFSTARIRTQWSDTVIAAVRAKHPDALR
jgi:hypothetical protein